MVHWCVTFRHLHVLWWQLLADLDSFQKFPEFVIFQQGWPPNEQTWIEDTTKI